MHIYVLDIYIYFQMKHTGVKNHTAPKVSYNHLIVNYSVTNYKGH